MILEIYKQIQLLTLAVVVSIVMAVEVRAQSQSDDQKRWFAAALLADLDAMAEVADSGVDVDLRDESGATALISAALNGDADVVRFLLERGANTDARAATGATPLMVAAWQGHLESVQLLLGAGADANSATTSNGATALIFAAQEGHVGVVEELLAGGAQIDAQAGNGTTALMAATSEGRIAVVRALLKQNANISLQKRSGASAMTIAASKGRDEISELLAYFVANDSLPPLPEPAPTSSDVLGQQLIESARIGDELQVLSLLSQNAPIDHRNEAGETALIVAAEGGYATIVSDLLLVIPDLEATRAVDGATALAVAAISGHLEAVRVLLDAGSEVDATLADKRGAEPDNANAQATPETGVSQAAGVTPLTLAASLGHDDIVTLLLERGADPGALDSKVFAELSSTVEAPTDPAFVQASVEQPQPEIGAGEGELVSAAPTTKTDVTLRTDPPTASVPESLPPEGPRDASVSTTTSVEAPELPLPTAVPFDPDDRETVRKIQSMLSEAGFSPGPADGLIGKRTRTAIRDYEREIGMDETGEISERVFERLQMETSG